MANFTIFSTISRSPGTYTSPSASYSGRTTVATWQLVSATWGSDSPSILVGIQCQWSFDGGTTWSDVTGTSTNPGDFNVKTGGLPSGAYQAGDNLGARLVRVQMILSGTLTVGMTGSAS